MPSSQQWNDDIYFRFNTESVSREFGIPLKTLEDFDAFLVTAAHLDFLPGGVRSGKFCIYPLHFNDVNNLIRQFRGSPLAENFWRKRSSLRTRKATLDINFPEAMAVLNLTHDSFYPGSRIKEEDIEEKLDEIGRYGIRVVDIGGQSTRPGSERISPQEEIKRISKAVEASLNRKFIVSIDSFEPEVLRNCLEMGVHLINDVTGLENEEVGRLARKYDTPLVIMHKKGDFKTMQNSPSYENVINEIIDFYYQKISLAARLGIEDNIVLDPGIGFGKRVEDNLAIINNLRDLRLGHPLLIGLSRKNFIGVIMNEPVGERGESSLILNTISLMNGADMIRVHDVRENSKLIKIIKKLKES